MVAKVNRKVKHDALILDASGVNQVDIARTLGISKSTLARAKHKLKTTGDIEGGAKKEDLKENSIKE
jgi:predicted transcriptional regulator